LVPVTAPSRFSPYFGPPRQESSRPRYGLGRLPTYTCLILTHQSRLDHVCVCFWPKIPGTCSAANCSAANQTVRCEVGLIFKLRRAVFLSGRDATSFPSLPLPVFGNHHNRGGKAGVMAVQHQSKTIEDNPIGNGLDAFRESFNSICEEGKISSRDAVLGRLGHEGNTDQRC
jgi:hypothetical protein